MAIDTAGFSSSNLLSGSYDAETETMTIQFHSGHTWEYRNVPQGIWEGLKAAASAGSYFHRQIKGRFGGSEVS